jgi:hypothetical protein
MLKISKLTGALLLAATALGGTGCIKKVLLEGQIASTRKASVAVNTIGDYEVAEKAAMAGLAQLEGFRYLAPDNADALFMLTRSWASVGFGFIEDAMERAEDAEGTSSVEWDYNKRRAEAAYDRAIWYGTQLLEKGLPNRESPQGPVTFKGATKNADTMREFLQHFDDAKDAEMLFWLGYAWLGKTNVAKERPEVVGELHVAVALLERSAELDENYMHGAALTALGAYHARSASAELDEAKTLLEKAMKIAEGKTLMPKVQMALRYYCNKKHVTVDAATGAETDTTDADRKEYTRILEEVVASGDLDPYQRLPNTIAKRKALRFLNPKRMRESCSL